MKLIIAILPDTNSDTVSNALTSANYRVTYIASTGGFLRHGHSTMLIGLEDEQVEPALQIIRQNSATTPETAGKRGVVFVLKVDQYIHF
jgi:uncharacterized protein YaaQ